MINSDSLRQALNQLISHLLILHKGLLDYQVQLSQERDGKKYNPYEMLDKAMKDPRFQWLRGLSLIISQIEEQLSLRNREKPLSPAPLLNALVELLDGKNKDFVGHYSLALVADPRLAISEVDVRKSIAQVRAILPLS